MLSQDFPWGTLWMSDHPYAVVGSVFCWLDNPVNGALLCAEALLLLLVIKDLIASFGLIGECIWRSKALVSIEHSIRYARIRDKVAFCVLPLIVMECIAMRMLGMTLPVVILMLLSYYLARRVLYAVVKRGRIPSEIWMAGRNAPNLFAILLAFVWVVTMVLMLSLGVADAVVEQVMLIELGAVSLLCLSRQFGILKSYCGSFHSFLYLCALEILPMAGVIFVVLLIS